MRRTNRPRLQRTFCALLLAGLCLTGCQEDTGQPGAASSAVPTATPTQAPMPTPTVAPAPTQTPLPSPTFTPTPAAAAEDEKASPKPAPRPETAASFLEFRQMVYEAHHVLDSGKWSTAMFEFKQELERMLDEADYGGASWKNELYEGIAVTVGIEIWVVNQEPVEKTVTELMKEYGKYGDIEIVYIPSPYPLTLLNQVYQDIKNCDFYNKKKDNGFPYICSMTVAAGGVQIILNAEFPELEAFLEDYPYRDCIGAGVPTHVPPNV